MSNTRNLALSDTYPPLEILALQTVQFAFNTTTAFTLKSAQMKLDWFDIIGLPIYRGPSIKDVKLF